MVWAVGSVMMQASPTSRSVAAPSVAYRTGEARQLPVIFTDSSYITVV